MTDTQPAEREPAPRRRGTYPGDTTALVADRDNPEHWMGPCRRGIVWRPTHAEYDAEIDKTRVIFAPVSLHELAKVPGLLQRLELLQQEQAMAAGAVARIGS